MKRIAYGSRQWDRWLARLPRSSALRSPVLRETERIVRAVRTDGDRALVRLTARLDGVPLTPARLRVKPREIRALAARADRPLVAALRRICPKL